MRLAFYYVRRSLPARWRTHAPAALGVALTTAVLVTMLTLASGFATTLAAKGRADNLIMLQRGAVSDLVSRIPRDVAARLAVLPGVAARRGSPLISPENAVALTMPLADGPHHVIVRGVTPAAAAVHDGVRLLRGRWFQTGLPEVMIGRQLQARMTGLEVGGSLTLRRRTPQWKVVGVFEDRESGSETEIWGDLDVMAPLLHWVSFYQSVSLRLEGPEAFEAIQRAIGQWPDADIQLERETAYYARQAGPSVLFLRAGALLIALIMGTGALVATVNTLQATVQDRRVELATIRALGFSSSAVGVALLAEILAVSLVGGLLGCAIAASLNGRLMSLPNAASFFSQVGVTLRFDPAANASGLACSVAIGGLASFLSAWRASRRNIAEGVHHASM